MSGRPKQQDPSSGVRLDKWLWAARFFKTRQLAHEAIEGGRVHLNGQRTKPGKDVTVGARLEISKDQLTWDITVTELSARRGPAKEAVQLYQESPESIAKRQAEVERRREMKEHDLISDGRPSKRDRRLIHRFKSSLD